MLEVEGSEELNEVVLHPYPNKNYSIVVAGETKLCLGIECANRTSARCLILFVKTEKGIHELDWLYFSPSRNERDRRVKPFWWSSFDNHRGQTREDVKERLKALGFNPDIVDRVYPPESR